MGRAWRVAVAGVAAQGVTYGFARYGYGLFLPDMRAEFGLSVGTLGLIASATYIGYLVALVLVGALVTRVGPRPIVVAAGVFAAVGMLMAAVAPSPGVLVAGLVIAGTTPALAWTPFSDAVGRVAGGALRDRVLALIPSGTAFAVALAGPLVLLTGAGGWRYAWAAFAVAALLVAAYAARVLPARSIGWTAPALSTGAGTGLPRLAPFLRPGVRPLFVTALSYGLAGAVYWSFALEAVSRAAGSSAGSWGTGPGSATGPVFWTLIGVTGVAGSGTGTLIARVGLRRAHAMLLAALAAGIALLGVAPGSTPAVLASAMLYGPAFMAISGLLALWSHRVFPERPSAGFSVVVGFLGVGTIVGPGALGLVAQEAGLPAVFLIAAGIVLLTVPARPAGGDARLADGSGRTADRVRSRGGSPRRTLGRRRRWAPCGGTPPP